MTNLELRDHVEHRFRALEAQYRHLESLIGELKDDMVTQAQLKPVAQMAEASKEAVNVYNKIKKYLVWYAVVSLANLLLSAHWGQVIKNVVSVSDMLGGK